MKIEIPKYKVSNDNEDNSKNWLKITADLSEQTICFYFKPSKGYEESSSFGDYRVLENGNIQVIITKTDNSYNMPVGNAFIYGSERFKQAVHNNLDRILLGDDE